MTSVLLRTCLRAPVLPTNSRALATSARLRLKEIIHTEEDNKILVKGVKVGCGPSTTNAITEVGKKGGCGGGASCHPFCRHPLMSKVAHTDVLILDQFTDSRGCVYPGDELKICQRQWARILRLVKMAQRAGLMPGKEFYCGEWKATKWGDRNCYWDEKTIDIQWEKNARKRKQQQFTTGFFKDY